MNELTFALNLITKTENGNDNLNINENSALSHCANRQEQNKASNINLSSI